MTFSLYEGLNSWFRTAEAILRNLSSAAFAWGDACTAALARAIGVRWLVTALTPTSVLGSPHLFTWISTVLGSLCPLKVECSFACAVPSAEPIWESSSPWMCLISSLYSETSSPAARLASTLPVTASFLTSAGAERRVSAVTASLIASLTASCTSRCTSFLATLAAPAIACWTALFTMASSLTEAIAADESALLLAAPTMMSSIGRGVCIMPMTATATRHAIDTHMASLADTTLLEARRVARSE
mmetsp:Transcript_45969/g.107861  ORF Transcript_45969/g.107861 Transcript_45969/m.107861 type:complete len:244 (-) Transcript_45969:87-818(-)